MALVKKYDETPLQVLTDKVTRARGITGWCESGRVFLPYEAPWVATFLSEICSFPRAEHDDQVDALTLLLKRLLGGYSAELWTGREEQQEKAPGVVKAETQALLRPWMKPIDEMTDEELEREIAERESGKGRGIAALERTRFGLVP